MAEPLSPRTLERLEQIIRSIHVAPEIDEAVHRELMAHMQDKLLGYLDGCEKLSEEDALLLVERHFGNPRQVEGLLRRVHGGGGSFGRRLAIVVLLAFLLATPGAFCDILSLMLAGRSRTLALTCDGLSHLLCVLWVAVLWLLLYRAEHAASLRRYASFLGWPNRRIVSLLLAAVALYLIPTILLLMFRAEIDVEAATDTNDPRYAIVRALCSLASWVLFWGQGWLWIWWVDQWNGRWAAVLASAGAWAAFAFTMIMLPMGLVKYAGLIFFYVYPIAVVVLAVFYALLYIPVAAVIRRTRDAAGTVGSIA